MADIIRIIRKRPGRYAFVGIPCFNKALRLLSRQDSVLQDRVSYYIGLICGHLKSSRFADMLAWQCGISPGGITSIDFRKKIKGLDANKYGVELEGFSGGKKIREIRKNKDFFGYLWSHGFFKYQACDYCDDVFAETSDVTVGDAWIPQYISDYMGTNIVIVRSHVIHDIIQKARSRERINMKSIPLKDILLSQDAGLRHRRDGLAYRLYLKSESGKWYPPKRISPKKYSSNSRFARVNQLRMQIAEYSHKAFDKAVCMDDFSIFKKSMSLLIREHDIANGKTFLIRIKTRIKSKIKIWLNCLGFYKNS